MGMFLKGCNTKRSLSPVTMQSAFADTAIDSIGIEYKKLIHRLSAIHPSYQA